MAGPRFCRNYLYLSGYIQKSAKMAGPRFCRNYLYLSGYIQRSTKMAGPHFCRNYLYLSGYIWVYLEIYLGIFKGRFCRFWERGHRQSVYIQRQVLLVLGRGSHGFAGSVKGVTHRQRFYHRMKRQNCHVTDRQKDKAINIQQNLSNLILSGSGVL